MHPSVHRSTIYNSQDMEATKVPSTDDWIKKMWYVYRMEYYSTTKKNEIIPTAATWMERERLMYLFGSLDLATPEARPS